MEELVNYKLLGKDLPLNQTIERFQSALKKAGVEIVVDQELNPVPGIWSIHIHDKNWPSCFTNGKGSSKEAALASALGEFVERFATNFFFADFHWGTVCQEFYHHPQEKLFSMDDVNGILNPELLSFYSPDDLCPEFFIDRNSGRGDGIISLPFKNLLTEERIYFPVNILSNLYCSNGMAAGNSAPEAKVQALCEIMERFVKFKIIREGLTLPDIPEEVIERFPHIQEGIAKLRQEGYTIFVKDASLGGVFPVVNITLVNPDNGGCFLNFGSHPQFHVALERTLTELFQGRGLKSFDNFKMPVVEEEVYSDPLNLESHFIDSTGVVSWDFFSDDYSYEFSPWNFEGTTTEELKWISDIIISEGHTIYHLDYNHLGVDATRVIVPGMSEIYPPDDLIWNNCNIGADIAPAIFSINELDKSELRELWKLLEEREIDDTRILSDLLGISSHSKGTFGSMMIMELKLFLAIGLEREEEASHLASLCLQFVSDPKRVSLYKLLELLSEYDELSPAMESMFDRNLIELANDILDERPFALFGNEDFFGLDYENHQKMLASLDLNRKLMGGVA